MLCFVDAVAGVSITYEEIFEKTAQKMHFNKYVYTNDVKEIILSIVRAIVYGQDIILLDKDFSGNEIKSLGILETDLKTAQEISNKFSIDSISDFCKIAEKNIDKTHIGIYTSGTTGRPKRFDHTLRSLMRNIKINDKHRDDIWGYAYNITHYAGIQVLLQAIFNENVMVNLFGNNMSIADKLMRQYNCNCISATPTFYRNCLFSNDFPNEKVRVATFGGERFSNDLVVKAKSKFPNAKIRNIYASTEIGSLLSGNNDSFFVPDSLKEKIKFSNENHLLINKSLILHKEIAEEWYDTGDIVSFNEDGTFRFLSRDADFINVGGYKVIPSEVEDIISRVSGVSDVRVYGRDNSVMGKILMADIVSNIDDKTRLKNQILQEVKDNLQDFKVPRIIKFVEKIEYSRTGKKVH